ncbi:hypothetical protein BJX68DRAFT_272450 [Aspergillus pseudodeflectus]|uniref:Uncharacterized protein n=1 Tax=Aspergillus pseudodeflectus TaxID=176178 RepID=A0ABR4JFF2_9EURO
MYKLLPLALLAYGAAAAPESPTIIETTVADNFPTDSAISPTIIADPSSAFLPEPSTESTIIADPSSAFDPETPTGSDTWGDPTLTPCPSDPSTNIQHCSPSFPPWHTPRPIQTGGWTTSTIIADPTPGSSGAPSAPEFNGPRTTSTTIADPGFTGAPSALNAPLYAVAGVLAAKMFKLLALSIVVLSDRDTHYDVVVVGFNGPSYGELYESSYVDREYDYS